MGAGDVGRHAAKKIVAPLRIVYIVLAVGIGGLMLIAALVGGAMGVVDIVRDALSALRTMPLAVSATDPNVTVVENPYGLDGCWAFIGGRFTVVVGTPVYAAMFILSGILAFKRRWQIFLLATMFQLAQVVQETPAAIVNYAVEGRPVPLINYFDIHTVWDAIPYIPSLGLLLSAVAMAHPAHVLLHRSERTQRTFPVIAIASLATLIFLTGFGHDGTWARDFRNGDSDLIDMPAIGGLVHAAFSALAAAALLIGLVRATGGGDRLLNTALAFAAGLAFPNFLDVFDTFVGDDQWSRLPLYLCDAVTFLACAAALTLWYRARRTRTLVMT